MYDQCTELDFREEISLASHVSWQARLTITSHYILSERNVVEHIF